jgi:hypothetical protein
MACAIRLNPNPKRMHFRQMVARSTAYPNGKAAGKPQESAGLSPMQTKAGGGSRSMSDVSDYYRLNPDR